MLEVVENGPKPALRTLRADYQTNIGLRKQLEIVVLGISRSAGVIEGNSAREWRQVYDARVAAGNETEEQRASMLKILNKLEKDDKLQQEQMKLSSTSRFVRLEKPGHLVILEEPEAIVQEGKWGLQLSK